MATIQTFTYFDNSTLTNFKLWAQTISNALSTFGWTQTSDTGQVNWSSLAAVPGVSANLYEIWKSADSFSTTNPIFLKMEYGTGNTSGYPALTVTVGSGSNGAGILTNAGTRNTLILGGSNTPAAPNECDLSGATGRFAFCMWRGGPWSVIFSVERSHDGNGNDLGTYVTYACAGANTGSPYCAQQSIFPASAGGPYTYEPYGLTFQATAATTITVGNMILAVPFYPVVGLVDNPLLGLVCLKSADVADGAVFPVTLYGGSHTYLVAKPGPSYGSQWGGSSNNCVAIRWE